MFFLIILDFRISIFDEMQGDIQLGNRSFSHASHSSRMMRLA